MECPQCKNPLSVENASVCEWCGNQLPIPEESFFSMFGRWYSILKNYLKINKKRLIIIISCIILLIVILMNNLHLQHWFTENENVTNSETTNKQEIVPKGLKQTRAFEYLTKVRKELVENPDNFENIAIKYSQDSLLSSCKGIEVDNGILDHEFDEMASKLEVNQVSEIFEIKDSTGEPIKYVIMKLLNKGNGFYKAQYITRNIKLEIGQYYQGGIIFHLDENAEHGLIASKKDLGLFSDEEANQICENLELNGYYDWRLPSQEFKDELEMMWKNIGQGNDMGLGNIGGFKNYTYWHKLGQDIDGPWMQCMFLGAQFGYGERYCYEDPNYVRAVRAF